MAVQTLIRPCVTQSSSTSAGIGTSVDSCHVVLWVGCGTPTAMLDLKASYLLDILLETICILMNEESAGPPGGGAEANSKYMHFIPMSSPIFWRKNLNGRGKFAGPQAAQVMKDWSAQDVCLSVFHGPVFWLILFFSPFI